MYKTKKFFNELMVKAEQKKQALNELIHSDNKGMETYVGVGIVALVVLVVGGAIFVIVNEIFPELFTSIGSKLTEMLGEWNITNP